MSEEYGVLYWKEWQSQFCTNYYIEKLRSCGAKGKLKKSRFRSICWMVLLECLPPDHQSWIDAIKLHRQYYEEILDKYQVNPRKVQENLDININNPLSQSQQSPWNQFFQDSELKTAIHQDVVRTFPEIDFFQSSEIQKMMNNILFSYARENPDISYKQGMHELLAPIIYVLDSDQQAYLEVSKTEDLQLDIRIMLNQNYIEHDAFTLFRYLMDAVKTWYAMTESPYSENLINVSSEPFNEKMPSSYNLLDVKFKNIYKHLLKHHDVELFLHLEQMEITPQIYGIRWVRLLFGREFPIHDLLTVWDAIFADGIAFNLVDYIFVAMLIAIRELLLKSDYATCLRHLMHYPKVTNVQGIINLAFYLRDPSMGKPDMSFIQVTDVPQLPEKTSPLKSTYQKNSFMSQIKPTSVKSNDSRPKSLKLFSVNKANASSENTAASTPEEDKMGDETIKECENEFFHCANKETYNTFPRVSIRNVMGNKNFISTTTDITINFGHVEDKNALSKSVYKEMVPLAPSNRTVATEYFVKKNKNSLKEDLNELQSLHKEITDLKLMNEYCVKQITQNITKLQECMINQRLLYEDDIFVALAGLKRARDILKRTVAFNEEVMDDDPVNYKSHSCQTFPCDISSSVTYLKNLEITKSELSEREDPKNGLEHQVSSVSLEEYEVIPEEISKTCDISVLV